MPVHRRSPGSDATRDNARVPGAVPHVQALLRLAERHIPTRRKSGFNAQSIE
jgi:hypothetical protein